MRSSCSVDIEVLLGVIKNVADSGDDCTLRMPFMPMNYILNNG